MYTQQFIALPCRWPMLVRATLAMLWLACCLPAHAAEATLPADAPLYVVTMHPLAEIVREVAGERAQVERLLPPAASPHTYEPRPADAARVERATALISCDPSLDNWAARLPARNKIELFALVPAALKIKMPASEPDEHDHADEHAHGPLDPHFWSDPLTVKAMLPTLAARLAELDPAGRAAYEAGATTFAKRLDALHAELQQTLAPVKGQAVMLFHPSLLYMLRRYELPYAGSIEPFPGKEATPRYIQQVLATLREKQVRALFTEPQLPPRAAKVVAEAAGLPLHELDPEGGRPGRERFEDLLRYNAQVLAKALQ